VRVCMCVCVLNSEYFVCLFDSNFQHAHFRALSFVTKPIAHIGKNVANSEGIISKFFKFLEMCYLE